MNPVPTIYPLNLLNKPSLLPTQQTTRSLSRKIFFPDELLTFQQQDIIRIFQDLNESVAPTDFQFKELDNCVLYFDLAFDDKANFPKILKSIKVDDGLHVQWLYNGTLLPLSQWFAHEDIVLNNSVFLRFKIY